MPTQHHQRRGILTGMARGYLRDFAQATGSSDPPEPTPEAARVAADWYEDHGQYQAADFLRQFANLGYVGRRTFEQAIAEGFERSQAAGKLSSRAAAGLPPINWRTTTAAQFRSPRP